MAEVTHSPAAEDRAHMTEEELAAIHTDIPVSLYEDFIVHLFDTSYHIFPIQVQDQFYFPTL